MDKILKYILAVVIGSLFFTSCDDPSVEMEQENPNGKEENTDTLSNKPTGKIYVETGNAMSGSCLVKAKGSVHGVKKSVEVGFLFGGTTELSFQNDSKFVFSSSQGEFTLTMKGLVDDCVNYYRAYALVNGKYYYGEVKSIKTEQLTYVIDDRVFKMIKVEDGPQGEFSIMQTEIPLDASFDICGVHVPYDTKVDGVVNNSELKVFIENLKTITGLDFRLPTAEEWMYAAQGGKYSHGYTYSGSDNISDVAWYNGNSGSKPHPVAQKKANELELYDMSGNYSELVLTPSLGDNLADGYMYGGNYLKDYGECKVTSYQEGKGGTAKIPGTNQMYRYCMEPHETVRLVYSRY